MAGCTCTVGEMNSIMTVVFLNEIVVCLGVFLGEGGGGVLSWFGQPLLMVIGHH